MGAIALLAAALLGSGCSAGAQDESAADRERQRVERIAQETPAQLKKSITRVLEESVARVTVTPSGTGGDEGALSAYTQVIGPDGWRVETTVETTAAAADGETAGGERSEPAVLLAAGGDVCFDRDFRPRVAELVVQSHGVTEFDRRPWTCTANDFGLTGILTFHYERADPRMRLGHLTVDDPGVYEAEIEEVDGTPLLHVTTTGVTADGPLDPERPEYEVWIDAERRLVRMQTTDLTWELDYSEDWSGRLTPPPSAQRGSYGYDLGPGPGTARQCLQTGACPTRPPLTWGDGRQA